MRKIRAELSSSSSMHTFMIRWRQALDGKVKRGDTFWEDGHAFWEGELARAELRRRGELGLVRLETGRKSDRADVARSIVRDATDRVCTELKTYRKSLNRVRVSAEMNRATR